MQEKRLQTGVRLSCDSYCHCSKDGILATLIRFELLCVPIVCT